MLPSGDPSIHTDEWNTERIIGVCFKSSNHKHITFFCLNYITLVFRFLPDIKRKILFFFCKEKENQTLEYFFFNISKWKKLNRAERVLNINFSDITPEEGKICAGNVLRCDMCLQLFLPFLPTMHVSIHKTHRRESDFSSTWLLKFAKKGTLPLIWSKVRQHLERDSCKKIIFKMFDRRN